MFDTAMIGNKIKQARINKNMTQLNLADAMGVSYQAVSNWERGNSMPDISKLGDLCRALDLSVNELLGLEENVPNAVTKAMDRDPMTMEELTEVAPMLPPEEVKERVRSDMWLGPDMGFLKGMKDMIHKAEEKKQDQRRRGAEKKKLDLSRIADMAPFLDQDYLDSLVREADMTDLDGLDEIAPFLSRSTLDYLVAQVDIDGLDEIVEIAPFLSKETIDRLVSRCVEAGKIDTLEELAPFISRETLDAMVDRYIEGQRDEDLSELYPFLSKTSMKKLVEYQMSRKDLDALEDLLSYM